MDNDLDLEKLWNDLLSRETKKVKMAFARLDKENQQAILQHLTRMSTEPGWHPEQRASAEVALQALVSNN
jgi:hypothetical protein